MTHREFNSLSARRNLSSYIPARNKNIRPPRISARINPCIWASSKTQSMNRRNNFIVNYKVEEKPLKQWCEDLNLEYKKVFARIKQLGWTIDKALSTK